MQAAIIDYLKKATESSPWLWRVAWWSMNRLGGILPHDRSYRGLAKFPVPADSAVLDVGANSGISALYFLRLFSNARVLSLEPNPVHAADLRAIKRRHDRYDFKLVGAGEAEGEFTLYTPIFGSVVLHTFSSVDEAQVRSALAKTYREDQLRRIRTESITCKLVPIDSLDIQPAIIKIDAEGHELQVLRGALRTIERSQPVILFEASHVSLMEICSELAQSGYQVFQYDPASDIFTHFVGSSVPYFSGGRNLYALPRRVAASIAMPLQEASSEAVNDVA